MNKVSVDGFGGLVELVDLDIFLDTRGYLIPVRQYLEGEIGNIYLTTAIKGAVKAWHCHQKQTDRLICVQGRAKIGLALETEEFIFNNSVVLDERVPKMLIIRPGIWHGFMCLSGKEVKILNVSDRLYDPGDELRKPWDWIRDFWQPGKG